MERAPPPSPPKKRIVKLGVWGERGVEEEEEEAEEEEEKKGGGRGCESIGSDRIYKYLFCSILCIISFLEEEKKKRKDPCRHQNGQVGIIWR